jgi:hypothetical protein
LWEEVRIVTYQPHKMYLCCVWVLDWQVKMVTADDEQTTDILVEGDKEEIERMTKELQLMEKGKIYVKGLLEK